MYLCNSLNEQRWMSPQDVDEFKDEVENAQKKVRPSNMTFLVFTNIDAPFS
jgi:hypothetical protein